jgi:branched-subunit amino acid aminotransferase/4-amino-4-deoxychorismate lyase
MSSSPSPIVLVDGREPSAEQLAHLALVNYGHFTAMQVRGGATRGLGLHLHRLRAAHAELFGTALDTDLVRHHMRAALDAYSDAYLRVTVYEREPGIPQVMTVIRPPVEPAPTPQSLLPVFYLRPFAHIKHVGSFAQIRYGEEAERQGYDDALLVGPDGRIAETTIANIGFLDGEHVIWPDGPSLRGITWQLLDQALDSVRTPARQQEVTVDSASRYDGAFIANSLGLSPVGQLGHHRFPAPPRAFTRLSTLYTALPVESV